MAAGAVSDGEARRLFADLLQLRSRRARNRFKKTGPTGAPGTAIYRYPFQAGIPRWIVRRGSADRFQLDGDYFFSRIDIVARMIQNIHE